MIVWLIGLAGSGKSTVGRRLYEKWKAIEPATVLVDGDELREIFRHNQGDSPYSIEGRRQNADRIRAICAWLDRQQINVVCCILSIFEENQNWNRSAYSDYLEVYLAAPWEDLKKRRKLYEDAIEGRKLNVVGVDIPFVPPANPHLTFQTGDADPSPEVIADEIFAHLMSPQ
jgi:cytidine diphosphoramidate kinase